MHNNPLSIKQFVADVISIREGLEDNYLRIPEADAVSRELTKCVAGLRKIESDAEEAARKKLQAERTAAETKRRAEEKKRQAEQKKKQAKAKPKQPSKWDLKQLENEKVRLPSGPLAAIIGDKPRTLSEISEKIEAYISVNDLEDAKRMVQPDAKLKALFGPKPFFVYKVYDLCTKLAPSWKAADPKTKPDAKTKAKPVAAPVKKSHHKKIAGPAKPPPSAVKNTPMMRSLFTSPALEDLIGLKSGAHTEITKRVWDYIKQHNLQDPDNRRNILPDAPLARVTGMQVITMFELNKALEKHLGKKPFPPESEALPVEGAALEEDDA